jgi:hypothetical protein
VRPLDDAVEADVRRVDDPSHDDETSTDRYRLASEGRAGLIFEYATLDERTLRRGVTILAQVVDDLRRRPITVASPASARS